MSKTLDRILDTLREQNAKTDKLDEKLESVNVSLGFVQEFTEKLSKTLCTVIVQRLDHLRWAIGNQSDLFNEYFQYIKQGDLQREEDRRELMTAMKGKDEKKTDDKSGKLAVPLGLAGILSALGLDKLLGPLLTTGLVALLTSALNAAAALALGSLGFVTGLAAGLATSYLKLLGKMTFKFLGKFADGFKTLGGSIDDFWKSTKNFFNPKVAEFKTGKPLKAASKVDDVVDVANKADDVGKATFLDDIMARGKKFIQIFTSAFDDVIKMFSATGEVGKGLAAVKAFFGKPIAWIADALSFFSKFAAIGKTIGKFLGPIGLVIAVIDGLYSSVTGFMKGFEEGGFLEGVRQGLTGLFDSIIGGLLDLLKDGAAWVLSKLGFDEAADILTHFSFSAMFSEIFGQIFDNLKLAGEWIGDMLTKAWEKIKSSLPDWMTGKKESFKGENLKVEEIHQQLDARTGSIHNRKFIKEKLLKDGYSDKAAEDLIQKAREKSLVAAPKVDPVGARLVAMQSEADNHKASAVNPVIIQGGSSATSVAGPVNQSANYMTINAPAAFDSTTLNVARQAWA